jgi:cell division protein FtsI (penicillin-binding protein 3)
MEATYDSVLNGENGTRIETKMTGGVWVPVDGAEVEPQDGKDLVTTLDIGIQEVAEHAMMSVLQQYECLYGTCIVMEVETGKIRALVNLGRQKNGSYWEDFNYAMIPTEPGSTFKLMTLIALLNDGYINVEDKINANGGTMRFGNRTMRDSHLGLGVMTIRDAFAHSSNVAMAKLAYDHYYKNPDAYVEQLKKLHLHERTGIDIAGERRPLVKTTKNQSWSATTLPWMAHGYEVLISPLHTCMVYNAVANNGKMMRPYLISAVREYGKNVRTFQPRVIEEAIGDSSTVAQLQACTRAVAITGTAKHIQGPFYNISGKTGTAQVADKGIKYSDRVYQGSFVGYFPSEKPKYTVAVVIRTKPHSGAYYGGTIAAPVFRMVADKIFANSKGSWMGPLDSIARNSKSTMLAQQATANAYRTLLNSLGKKANIEPTNQVVKLVADSTKKVNIEPGSVVKGFVPDVSGLGLKDAVYLLEKEGLQVHIKGRGRVVAQSIAPGSRIPKGQTIVLQLS